MEVKECYQVLELEHGAPRDAVQAAYSRLIERWHPDGIAASGGPKAVEKAKQMIQAINTAYQTLTKTSAAAGPPGPNSPVPAPGSAAGGPKTPAAPASAPAGKTPKAPPPPPPSPLRRYAPILGAVGVLVLILIVSKCMSKSPEEVKAAKAELEAQTTGRLAVKSNRANTTIEVTRIPAAGEAASAPRKGPADGAAEQTLATLPPGKYALIAHSDGWPDINQEVIVEVGRTTDVAISFKSGSLRLDSLPAGATVKLGTAVLGKTPVVIAQLPPGENQLTLEYPGWPVRTFKTTIAENVEATETIRLPHGKLIVESSPPGATVLMGGKPAGLTPLTLEYFPVGTWKFALQAKDFPPLAVTATIEDGGEVKISPELGSAFPLLDPPEILRAVWVQENPDKLSPGFDSVTGPYQPQNGIVKNLHRKRLYENWLRKSYRFSAIVKVYDPNTAQVEMVEEKGDLSRYRVLAKLSPRAQGDKDLIAQLAKGATFTFYGRLSGVEEPKWPAKVITFEISAAEPLRGDSPAAP